MTHIAITDNAKDHTTSLLKTCDVERFGRYCEALLKKSTTEFRSDFDDVDVLALEVNNLARQRHARAVWDVDKGALKELCTQEVRTHGKNNLIFYQLKQSDNF